MLRGVWETAGPPLGCTLLMLLMFCVGLMGNCKQLELHLETLQEAWDGHRLLTHALCAPSAHLLLLSLLILLLLGWQLEERLGTLCYLHLSCLCTLCCATLYLLLSWLLPSPTVPASGCLATQLALLTAQGTALPPPLGRRLAPLLPFGILVTAQILCPVSPLLLHICGIISGLISRCGLLSRLELSAPRKRALEGSLPFRCLASAPLLRFIPCRDRGAVLPETDPRAGERPPLSYAYISQSVLLTDAPWGGGSAHSWPLAGDIGTPAPSLLGGPAALEEELLRIGIRASLREYEEEEERARVAASQELRLQKSSVSALRLQQLERMGFPTGPAVVALAATGKVERAVSLLVEGQVGGDVLVASEKQVTK